jgi:hypothetical protein
MVLRASSPLSQWPQQDLAEVQMLHQSTFVIIGTDRDRKPGALLALLARADEQGLA